MGETTKYSSSSSLLDMKTKGYKGENEVEEFPCISPVDDGAYDLIFVNCSFFSHIVLENYAVLQSVEDMMV